MATRSTTTQAIHVQDLARSFNVGKRKQRTVVNAVRDLSFSIDAGERVAFIGPNGAGKSTSIKMLTGILFPSSGSAEVLGLTPWEDRKQLALRIGTLFGQRSQLWAELPPRRSLRVLGAIFGLTDDQTDRRLAELGEVLEADELYDQPIRTQSLGQRMRCELTACMLHEPELLFLDEPTIGLDLLGKQLFRDLLIRLNDEIGTTIFLTSHDVADIERVAQRAIVVNHGTIIYDNTVDAMRRELLATKRIEVGLQTPVDQIAGLSALSSPRAVAVSSAEANGEVPAANAGSTTFTALAGVTAAPLGKMELLVEVDTTQVPVRDVLDRLLQELPVADLSVVDPALETVISEIYRRPES